MCQHRTGHLTSDEHVARNVREYFHVLDLHEPSLESARLCSLAILRGQVSKSFRSVPLG